MLRLSDRQFYVLSTVRNFAGYQEDRAEGRGENQVLYITHIAHKTVNCRNAPKHSFTGDRKNLADP
jgi:hypothetical protein